MSLYKLYASNVKTTIVTSRYSQIDVLAHFHQSTKLQAYISYFRSI